VRRVSVSELLKYIDCERAWKHRYVDRLAIINEKRGGPLSSGTAVHYVVEHVCTHTPGEIPPIADVRALANECLEAEFSNSSDPDKQIKKFLPGVMRAVSKIPDDIWLGDWHIEWDLSTVITVPCEPELPDEQVEFFGRPDLWRWSQDGVIELVDVKTTAQDPGMYMLFEPQITYYAVMLQDEYPNALITYRYLCVPTQGDHPAQQAPVWPFTSKQIARARTEISQGLNNMDEAYTQMRRMRRCDWCEFKHICMAEITGADPSGIVKELYKGRDNVLV
jgi:hypothetical protein